MKTRQWLSVTLGAMTMMALSLTAAPPQQDPQKVTVQQIKTLLPKIPAKNRLMVDFSKWTPDKAKQSFAWAPAEKIIMTNADHYMKEPLLERKLEGRRLLGVARLFHDRVMCLTMAWKFTGEEKYVRRAIKEMHNVCKFSDWHPSHYLGTAEFLLGMATGLDYLDPFLTAEEKKLFKKTIIEKGLKPGDEDFWWVNGYNNWTQVCHAAIVAGALICAEEDPDLSARLIQRALKNVPNVMRKLYFPKGCYPEGASYWGYGTSYNCYLIALLEHAFGTDFGMSNVPGWADTGIFYSSCFAPNGSPYQFYDGSNECMPSVACFFHDTKYPGKLYFSPAARKRMDYYSNHKKRPINSFSLYYSLFYMHKDSGNAPPPPLWYWSGTGADLELLMVRDSWSDDALYLGIKGGSARNSHGHMDAGSFVICHEGVFFVCELGNERYHNIEREGLKLWNLNQDSDRWTLFRYGMRGHSVIRINDDMQNVNGNAVFTEVKDLGNGRVVGTVDLSSQYDNAKSVTRTADFSPERIVITDKLTGLKPGAKISFQYMTYASIAREGNGALLMTNDGKKMRAQATIRGMAAPEWKDRRCSEMLKPYERGTQHALAVSFDIIAPASGNVEYTVVFTPVSAEK